MNSRSLCVSDSIGNCFITPNHSCIGRSWMFTPELPGEVVTGSQLVRFKLVRSMFDRFWSMRHNAYLAALRTSTLSVKKNRVPLGGELVFVKDELSSPSCWPLARIKLLLDRSPILGPCSPRTSCVKFLLPVSENLVFDAKELFLSGV